jgi:lipoprotein-anchoring transpeptidase ErfK/SrfK/murein DD-endopeptidase MepM/ murein hydrolase activator NlpD
MKHLFFCLLLCFASLANAAQKPAEKSPVVDRAMQSLTVQVLLDRQNYSPGEIDASLGTNTRRALNEFEKNHNLPLTEKGQPGEETLKALAPEPVEALTEYTITADDVRGPFVDSIPKEFLDQAKLKSLSYTSALEELGEKFHCSPDLLKKLNKDASWKPGEKIQVPNIDLKQGSTPSKGSAKSLKIIVTETTSSLRLIDANGNLLFYSPVTAGSKMDPLPFGDWKIVGVGRNPKFHYNPDLFWDAKATDTKATLPAGPNNPVGVVWIDLDAPHYGLHGTPEPSKIGYTESHGCVRLTNWDALRLANLIGPGTVVVFQQDESGQQEQTPAQGEPSPQTQQSKAAPPPQPSPPPEPSPPPQKVQEKPSPPKNSNSKSGGIAEIIQKIFQPQQPPPATQSDVSILKKKKLTLPVKGIALEQLTDSFYDARAGHRHEAIDILAPRNSPVLAVEDGRIVKLWLSVPGGITIYQFDPTESYAYYYAHLERYADQIKEGTWVHRGQVIGYVGTSGNAPPRTPHLHFTIFKLTPEKHWWQGQAVNPYTVFKG